MFPFNSNKTFQPLQLLSGGLNGVFIPLHKTLKTSFADHPGKLEIAIEFYYYYLNNIY